MRVLVTGGTGFVGSHTVAALVAAGHEPHLLVRDPGKLENLCSKHDLPRCEYTRGDMTDAHAVRRALEGCDGVVHAAALVALERARARQAIDTNLRGTELVLGTARQMGVERIVYVSTAAVLFDPARGPIRPTHPVAPSAGSAYGLSKSQCELFVRGLQEAGVCVRTVYPLQVIGPRDPGLSEGNQGLKMLMELPRLIPSAGGMQAIDVRDLAAIHVALLEADPAPERHVTAGQYLTWAQVCTRLDGLTGNRTPRLSVDGRLVRWLGRLGDEVQRWVDLGVPLTAEAMEYASRWPGADSSQTLAEFGVSFRPLEETFEDTLRWLHEAGHLSSKRIGRLARPRRKRAGRERD
ncbi:MAG: NAD-dependent epimerase/dehydratase family protein [Deltaproteobacteria bacterium]|nr:NAD-dependent epimerase/dehydratase family protein [Deltaproteobacteria bacterium]